MELFKKTTTIDFMGQRKWAALISTLLFVGSVLALCIHGLNWGLDFTGGICKCIGNEKTHSSALK